MKNNPEMEKKIDGWLDSLTLDEKILLTAGRDLWLTNAIDRLGIPSLKMSDGPNGIRGETRDDHPVTSASFPVGSAMGATWDPDLIQKVGVALAEEAISKQTHIILGPTVNMHRIPAAGRNFECFSEDPYLTSVMATAYIRGIQSQGVAACIKHYVCNDQEYERFTISSEVSEQTLREIYLAPFKAAVIEADVWAVMSAYNRVNGTYASENDILVNGILKGEWGFNGLVISDWYGTYSENSAIAGCDLEMPGPARWMGKNLKQLLKKGNLKEDRLDDQVRRLLRLACLTEGVPSTDIEEQSENRPEHRELIKRVGEESIVLLKNQNDILPLRPTKTNSLAVIGQLATQVSFQGGGSSQVTPHYLITPLKALNEHYPGEVVYAQGYDINKQLPVMGSEWLLTTAADQAPLEVEYFDNIYLQGKVTHRKFIDKTDLSWFGETAEHWNPSSYSVRVKGSFTPPEKDTYQLCLSFTGRAKLFIDDKLVIDHWNKSSVEQHCNLKLELTSIKTYNLKIEFACDLDLRWRMLRLGIHLVDPGDLLTEAVNLAASTDTAIILVGLTPEWESEGFDRPNLELPGSQNELIKRISGVNPNTIVVLNSGSPVTMPWANSVSGILQMWYLGQESGNALTSILMGMVNPSGKLPTTFPQRLEDTPAFKTYPGKDGKVVYLEELFIGYRYADKHSLDPLFPFGFGLSYTKFDYLELLFSTQELTVGDALSFQVKVANIGKTPGKEVIQVYIHNNHNNQERPIKELKAFKKISINPGEVVSVPFIIESQDLEIYDDEHQKWRLEPGKYTLLVGSSSREIHLTSEFRVNAREKN